MVANLVVQRGEYYGANQSLDNNSRSQKFSREIEETREIIGVKNELFRHQDLSSL